MRRTEVDALRAAWTAAPAPEARLSVDNQPLYSIFAGDALRHQQGVIQKYQDNQEYAIWELYNQQFETFNVDVSGDKAMVRQTLI